MENTNIVKLNNDWVRDDNFDKFDLTGWFNVRDTIREGFFTHVDFDKGEKIALNLTKNSSGIGHFYTIRESVNLDLSKPILFAFTEEDGSVNAPIELKDWNIWTKDTSEDEEPCTAGSTTNSLPEPTAEQLLSAFESMTNSAGGIKFDTQKTQPGLLYKDLVNACAAVIRVLDLGAKKYSRANYLKVEDVRYEEAMLRHLQAYFQGEAVDPESGESHLAHVVCCVMFMLEKKARGINL